MVTLAPYLQDTHTTRMDARKKQKSNKQAMAEEMAAVQAAKVAEANRWGGGQAVPSPSIALQPCAKMDQQFGTPIWAHTGPPCAAQQCRAMLCASLVAAFEYPLRP